MLIKKITTLLLCTFACHANTLSAQDSLLQNDKLLLRDYRYIEQSSPWLTQRNAAGLTLLGYGKSVAQAEVSLGAVLVISFLPMVHHPSLMPTQSLSPTIASIAARWYMVASAMTTGVETTW